MDGSACKQPMELRVTVVSASGLKTAVPDSHGSAHSSLLGSTFDPLCVCEVVGKPDSRFQTPAVFDAVEPVWTHDHTYTDFLPGDALTFTIWNKEVGAMNEYLGRATLDASQFEKGYDGDVVLTLPDKAGKTTSLPSPKNMLTKRRASQDSALVLRVQIKWRPKNKNPFSYFQMIQFRLNKADDAEKNEGGPVSAPSNSCAMPPQKLKVKITSASGLRGADWLPGQGSNTGLSDPYCTVEILGKPDSRMKTAVIAETHDPEWNFEGHFDNYSAGDTLFFAVFDEDWGKTDDLLGCTELPALHFDPVAFDGEIRLNDAGPGMRSMLKIRVELADFEKTLGVSTKTGLGIRRKLWSTWSKYAKVQVTQNIDERPSMSGLHLRRRLRRAPGELAKAMAQKKRAAKLVLIDLVWARRDMVLTAVRDTIKEACIGDPDMWIGLRHWLSRVVDELWCDIMVEVEIMVEATRLGVAGHSWHDVESLAEEGWAAPYMCHPLALRGWFLHRYLPYDKSAFGQIKDPVYLFCVAISFAPVLRCFFFLFVLCVEVMPGPPDEYQLVQFILNFKATQFLSSGVWLSLMGTWKYFWCVGRDGTHTCYDHGPGESTTFGRDAYGDLGVIDIVGSCVLVWTAFLLLPYSEQNAGLRKRDDREAEEVEVCETDAASRVSGVDCFSGNWQWNRSQQGRGGRMAGLLRYDLGCFVFSVLVLVVLEMWRYGEDPRFLVDSEAGGWMHTWKFRETLYVTRVVYGFLAFPFSVFHLPILSQILTHTMPTGYNQRGACVPYLLPPVEPLESLDAAGNHGEVEPFMTTV